MDFRLPEKLLEKCPVLLHLGLFAYNSSGQGWVESWQPRRRLIQHLERELSREGWGHGRKWHHTFGVHLLQSGEKKKLVCETNAIGYYLIEWEIIHKKTKWLWHCNTVFMFSNSRDSISSNEIMNWLTLIWQAISLVSLSLFGMSPASTRFLCNEIHPESGLVLQSWFIKTVWGLL